jgi:hypothetical protein
MWILNSAFTANPLRTVASIKSHDLGEVASTVCKQDALNFDESLDHGHFLSQWAAKDRELRAIIRRPGKLPPVSEVHIHTLQGPLKGP